jgi:hypothetical protein
MIPQGAVIGSPQGGSSARQTTHNLNAPEAIDSNPDDNLLTKGAKAVGGVFQGMGEGVFSTLSGGAHLINKAAGAAGNPDIVPKSVTDYLDNMSTDSEGGKGTAQQVGYGGETLTEFLLGDEALKVLPLAKRLEAAAKAAKLAEGSPRAMRALQIGAAAMKQGVLHGAEAGIVQGAQSEVRSGGNTEESLKDAGKATLWSGGLGAATGGAARVFGKLGETAEKAESLSKKAGNAQTKEEVAKSISQKIQSAKDQLHSDYEAGIQDLGQRLQGAEVHPQENPLAEKATELLSQPDPAEHPLVAQAKQAAGDRLDKKVKTLLESISNGEVAGDEKPVEPSGLVDQFGNAIESEPEPKVAPPYKVNDLVNMRQTIRKLADSYEYGDVNSRALRALINGSPGEISPLDQTIEKLAQSSGDTSAVDDYRKLRTNYRDKINLFEEPVIQKLLNGKIDDAAKDFVGVVRKGDALPTAGKIRFNTDALRGIIGDDGVKDFGKQIFGTMLRDSVEDSRFNPAKFVETWNKVNDETKNDLFDMKNAQNGLKQLARDAQSAANLQHLTRAGVLTTAGAVAGHATPLGLGLGTLLGLTVAEGGGIAKGRELLNYIANHPAAWGTYKALGKAANSGLAETAATAARGGAAQASATATPAAQKKSALKNAYSGLSASLGQ